MYLCSSSFFFVQVFFLNKRKDDKKRYMIKERLSDIVSKGGWDGDVPSAALMQLRCSFL